MKFLLPALCAVSLSLSATTAFAGDCACSKNANKTSTQTSGATAPVSASTLKNTENTDSPHAQLKLSAPEVTQKNLGSHGRSQMAKDRILKTPAELPAK